MKFRRMGKSTPKEAGCAMGCESKNLTKPDFSEMKTRTIEAWRCAEERMDKIGCGGLPTTETHTKEQRDMLTDYAKSERVFSIYLALIIGFTNGVEWERKNRK